MNWQPRVRQSLQLTTTLGLRQQAPSAGAPSADMRLRAFNLFWRNYREAARGVRFLVLLLAPFVSRPMGARLREAGVQYLDQVGNMHIALSKKGTSEDAFVALVEGKRPAPGSRTDSAWRAPSYQVLFALLAEPTLLDAPVRTIATEAGVSTSPVLQVQTKLLHHRFAIRRGRTLQWTPHGWPDARDFWLHGYHATFYRRGARGNLLGANPSKAPRAHSTRAARGRAEVATNASSCSHGGPARSGGSATPGYPNRPFDAGRLQRSDAWFTACDAPLR